MTALLFSEMVELVRKLTGRQPIVIEPATL
jgi:hypothetical protein